MVLFMAGALIIVIIGVVIAMAVNGKFNKKHSNKLMRLRVLFQAIAISFFCNYHLVVEKLRFF